MVSSNLFATFESPKYSNLNAPNLCFDFFNDFMTSNFRAVGRSENLGMPVVIRWA